MSKKIIIYVAAILIVAAVSIVWLQERPKYTDTVEKVILAAYPDYAAPVYIAKEKGFLKEVGLDVDIKTFEAGRLAMNALLKDEADIATAADFVFVSDSFEKDDIRILGTVTVSNSTHEFLARKDSGIEKITDIKGKKVGVTKKSSGEYYFGNFLTENNLDLTDIELVDLQPLEIILAIEKGDIDAALTWEPNVFKIKKSLEPNVISFPAQSNQNLYFLLISKKEFITKNPEVLERFLKAMVKTEKFVKANPIETEEFVKQQFNYGPDYIKSAWYKFGVSVELSQQLLLILDEQARWRIKNKLTDKTTIPNYLNFIYSDGLTIAKPEAVTIIR